MTLPFRDKRVRRKGNEGIEVTVRSKQAKMESWIWYLGSRKVNDDVDSDGRSVCLDVYVCAGRSRISTGMGEAPYIEEHL